MRLSTCLLAAALALSSTIAADAATKITPGESWKDTSGSHINAHGCCVVYNEGTYYWFGEDRTGSTSNGVSCYTSTDLINWKRQGLVFKTSQALDPDTKKAILERPKVIYNAATGQWVMYCHWENGNGYGEARVCVATANKINGNYEFVSTFRPNNHDSRDQTVIVDSDGKAYHFCATDMNTNINVALLADDYLSPAEPATETKILKGLRLEAPAIIRKGDSYFGLFSECDGWNPTPGHRAVSNEILGYWEDCGNFCVDEGSSNTYKSQSTYILKVEGYDNAYIYMGDRWNSSDVGGKSEYVWLPLSLRSGLPTVKWHASWDMSAFADCDRWQRIQQPTHNCIVRILDKNSDRWISKPKQSLEIQDDNDATNVDFRFEATNKPYVWRIVENSTGYYLQSVMGILTLSEPNGQDSQNWHLYLQEDGCYKIKNEGDGKYLSISGSSAYAGSKVFMGNYGASSSQNFGLYFDVNKRDYEVADMFTNAYREQVAALIAEQEAYEREASEIDALAGASRAYGIDGGIAIEGKAGDAYTICAIDGCVMRQGSISADNATEAVSPGIYIVSIGNKAYRVLVR